jgi:hypothetical protein
MGKLTGAALIVAGVTIAAYALFERMDTGARSAAPGLRQVAQTSPAPDAPRQAEVLHPASTAPPPAPAAKSAERQPQPIAERSIPQPSDPLRIAEAPPRVPVDHNKAERAAPLDREGLTKEIQRQLKRVGCYGGAITGAWSPTVRQAMKAFTDRVNATLPVEQPDAILLALVQNHRQVACSASCPPGQAIAGNGRCQPIALVARAKNPHAPARAATSTRESAPGGVSEPSAVAEDPPMGRMSLAGPLPPAKRATRLRRTASPAARAHRYSQARARERRRAARAYGSGMPWWTIPVFSP